MRMWSLPPGSQRAWVIVVMVPDGDFYPEEFQSTLKPIGPFQCARLEMQLGWKMGLHADAAPHTAVKEAMAHGALVAIACLVP